MKRKIKIGILLFILIIIYIYVANITLFPKNILLIQGEKINLAKAWGVSLKEDDNEDNILTEEIAEASTVAEGENSQAGNKSLNINLFQIPVGKVSVNVISKTKVVPLRMCNRFKTIH